MTINFKKNGSGYTSGCTIAFGSREMRELKLVDKDGNLRKVESAENVDDNTIIIKIK